MRDTPKLASTRIELPRSRVFVRETSLLINGMYQVGTVVTNQPRTYSQNSCNDCESFIRLQQSGMWLIDAMPGQARMCLRAYRAWNHGKQYCDNKLGSHLAYKTSSDRCGCGEHAN